jgi:hypothetical protein
MFVYSGEMDRDVESALTRRRVTSVQHVLGSIETVHIVTTLDQVQQRHARTAGELQRRRPRLVEKRNLHISRRELPGQRLV